MKSESIMIGQTISHYKIVEKLGEGGMGVVYKAHDTQLDRYVALKFLPHYLNSEPAEKERFYHEARATSALNHPNITTIHEISEHDHQLYIAMEFVEGTTLKKMVEHGSPPAKAILDIAIQVCDGLAMAHEKGIVHRDIKSDNIMITPKGQVKVMDFGLAKVKGSVKLTRAGSTLGTAAYMSPEQALAEDVDHRSDIFSFGVVLYELLTAHLPFRGDHLAAVTYSLINEEPQPLRQFNQGVSQDMERIVFKALEKDRQERYQHIEDMQADLRKEKKHLEYARTGYVKDAGVPPSVRAKKRPAWIAYAIPAAVLLIIAASVFNPFRVRIDTEKTNAAETQSLAVMYFQNIADPDDKDHTGDMLADLLITSLSETKDLEVISRERLYDIQKEFKSDSRIIAPDLATKVAQRAGVTIMLLGSILQQEPTLAVTARIIDVQSGKILSSVRVIGYSSRQIFALVDTLALLVRNDLQVTTPGESRPVASVTTRSTEAYRSYIEGVELNEKYFDEEAGAAFRKAIELDSNFAMAYFALATSVGDLGVADRERALQRAYTLSGKLTERERLIIQNTYVSNVENDPLKAAGLMEEYIRKFPREKGAYINLGSDYGRLGDFEKTIQTYQRGLQIDSLDKNLWNILAYAQAGMNRRNEALAAIDRYLQLAPAEPNPYDSKGDVYHLLGETDSAIVWWKMALKFRSDFASSLKLGYQYIFRDDFAGAEKYFLQYATTKGEEQKSYAEDLMTETTVRQGMMHQAIRRLLEMAPRHTSRDTRDLLQRDYSLLAYLFDEVGDYDNGEKYARLFASERKKDSDVLVDGSGLLAYALQRNGKTGPAKTLLNELRKKYQSLGPEEQAHLDYTEGLLAFEQGDHETALQHFQKAISRSFPSHPPPYHRALSALKTGRTSEAIIQLRRLTWYSPIDNIYFDLGYLPFWDYGSVFSVKAHYWLGVAYETQGENKKAIAEYETFLRIWKNADFESKELNDAQVRLTTLKGATAQ